MSLSAKKTPNGVDAQYIQQYLEIKKFGMDAYLRKFLH